MDRGAWPWGHKESDTENESEGGFPGGSGGQEYACNVGMFDPWVKHD